MGRSANRLSSTRSGVVNSPFLRFGILCLPPPTPIPPPAPFDGEQRVSSLCHGRAEHIETADVLCLASDFAESFIQLFRVSPRELLHAMNSEHFEIVGDCWPYRNQVPQAALRFRHKHPP